MKVQFTVNGEEHTLDVEPRRLLSDVLRQDLESSASIWDVSTGFAARAPFS